MTVETARNRAAGLTRLIQMDIADALDLNPEELSDDWKIYAEVVATGVFVRGEINRIAHVGALAYIAGKLP